MAVNALVSSQLKGWKLLVLTTTFVKSFHCEYVQLWEAIKKYWALTMDDEEKETIKSISKKCED